MNKEKIVIEYLPLVRSIAAKYNKLGVPQEDLEQEGMIGLLKAAEKYDKSKGAKFSTYASYWIKKYILAAVGQEYKHLSKSTELNEDITQDKKTGDTPSRNDLIIPQDMPGQERIVLRLLYEKEFTLKEIADKLEISRERVRQLKEKALRRMRAKKSK